MITPFSLQIETEVLEELQFISSYCLHPEINVQVYVPIIMRYIGGSPLKAYWSRDAPTV